MYKLVNANFKIKVYCEKSTTYYYFVKKLCKRLFFFVKYIIKYFFFINHSVLPCLMFSGVKLLRNLQ